MVTQNAETPWVETPALPRRECAAIRRRMMFDHHKWDPQIHDVDVLSSTPMVLRASEWRNLEQTAEALSRELLAAEAELTQRPELWATLAIPRRIRAALRTADPSAGVARLMRFDFHPTPDGWRLSEVNADVPGGLIEASSFPRLVAEHTPDAEPVGDTIASYVDALTEGRSPGDRVSLIYATAYTDDAQVMIAVERGLQPSGLAVTHHAADDPSWQQADAAVRFYPAEWLPNLPRSCDWQRLFAGAGCGLSNPGAALLVQSKRWPLVWDQLATAVPTWRVALPQTRAAAASQLGHPDWVFKPAFGRVGEGIGMAGTTSASAWRRIRRSVRWSPGQWVMQRRFTCTPWDTPQGQRFPCVGVFVIQGRVAGAYGRAGVTPLIDLRAQDVAVLRERIIKPNRSLLRREVASCA